MASYQCYKPCEQTNHMNACHDQKGATYHNKHTNEHSFTDKVKEITHKIYSSHDHPNNTHVAHKHNDTNCFTGLTGHHEIKRHSMKKTEGHDGHCMPKLRDHHMKKNKKKSHKKREGGCNNDSESSSSSDESEDESCKKKC